MPRFSEIQKRIALLLMHQPKTAEELNKQLNIPYAELMEELKGMMKLDVLLKEGFPTKYKLKESISEEVKRRREIQEKDSNKVRLNAIIEIKAVSEEKLKEELKKVRGLIEKEPDFQVYVVKEAEIIKEGEHFSSYLEVNLSLKDFRAITKLVFLYGPTSIEVIKPSKIEITADDLQDSLIDMSDMVQNYNEFLAKTISKVELEQFRKTLSK